MTLSLQSFNYELPKELIAKTPAAVRDHSRLLFLRRNCGKYQDRYFWELPQILQELMISHPKAKNGVLIVRNDSQVIPARLCGKKASGGQVEVLLTRQLDSPTTWECLTKPGLKLGQTVFFEDGSSATCQVDTADYVRTLDFKIGKGNDFSAWLSKIGSTPVPPYIDTSLPETQLRLLYQTTYATTPGSVAAPTAGLHFTPELTQKLQECGIEFATVTLHVGPGTFLGVKTENVSQHRMHREFFSLSHATAHQINTAKNANKLILAVGTTTVRVLENCVQTNGLVSAQNGSTEIFIYPPYRFKIIDALITNFHLPKSTLLMLVSALVSAPNTAAEFSNFTTSSLGHAYQHAIEERYRFFSFGDAMLII